MGASIRDRCVPLALDAWSRGLAVSWSHSICQVARNVHTPLHAPNLVSADCRNIYIRWLYPLDVSVATFLSEVLMMTPGFFKHTKGSGGSGREGGPDSSIHLIIVKIWNIYSKIWNTIHFVD